MNNWKKNVLIAAGIYNIVYGTWVVLAPNSFFRWTELELPVYPMIWQSVGMIVGVYGIGYWISAYNPDRHWPIILVGFLGKLFGPIGFIFYAIQGKFPWIFGLHNLTNDIIWLVPFGIILYQVFRKAQETGTDHDISMNELLNEFKSKSGENLYQYSFKSPLLLIFLRHFGCTFCREAVKELQNNQQKILASGVTPVIVHMDSPENASIFLEKTGLGEIDRVDDPDCRLYRAFELQRGRFSQLFGWREWIRGFHAGIIKGYGLGKLGGDGFRLGGAFVVYQGQVVHSYRQKRASEKTDFCEIAGSANIKQFST
jgi:peroxiredoxin